MGGHSYAKLAQFNEKKGDISTSAAEIVKQDHSYESNMGVKQSQSSVSSEKKDDISVSDTSQAIVSESNTNGTDGKSEQIDGQNDCQKGDTSTSAAEMVENNLSGNSDAKKV